MTALGTPFPPFLVLTFGILRVERLIDARQGIYAAAPASTFRGTYPCIILRSLVYSPTRSLRRATQLDRMILAGGGAC